MLGGGLSNDDEEECWTSTGNGNEDGLSNLSDNKKIEQIQQPPTNPNNKASSTTFGEDVALGRRCGSVRLFLEATMIVFVNLGKNL